MSSLTRGTPVSSGTIVGTTFAQVLPANPQRQYLILQNAGSTGTLGFTIDGTVPVIGNSNTFALSPGISPVQWYGFVPTAAVRVIGSAAGVVAAVNSQE